MQSNGIFEPIVHFPVKTAPIFAYCFTMYFICTFYFCCADLQHFYSIRANLFYIIITFHLLIELLRKIGSNLIYNLVCNQFDNIVHIIIF